MAKGSGTTKYQGASSASAGRTIPAITGWSLDPNNRFVSPIKTSDLQSNPTLRNVLITENPEYKGITYGNYDGKIVVAGTNNAATAKSLIDDLQVAEQAQKEVDSYLKYKSEITNEVRQHARDIVAKYEKKIGKKLWR